MRTLLIIALMMVSGCSTTRSKPSIPPGWNDHMINANHWTRDSIEKVTGDRPENKRLPNLLFTRNYTTLHGWIVHTEPGVENSRAYWRGRTLYIPGPSPLPGSRRHEQVLKLLQHEFHHYYGILNHPPQYRGHVPFWSD